MLNKSKHKVVMTLCVLRQGNGLLMGMKKVRLGKGYYNGFGGKLDPGETLEECIKREVKEESDLDLLSLEKRGVMTFELVDSLAEVYIFEGLKWSGDPIETDEMSPIWLDLNNLPFERMWPSDKLWYPYFLNRIYFTGWVVFDENHRIIDYKIEKDE